MGSIADKLNKVITTKEAIRTSIANKGVSISESDAFDLYPSKIDSISGGGAEWTKPVEWPDITNVANNEINLLVSDRAGGRYSFFVTTSTGTYSVDWGDTTSTTGVSSGVQVSHLYSGGGTLLTNGERVYTIRIYTSGGNLTRFYVDNYDSTLAPETQAYLWAQFGTMNLTSIMNMFGNNGVYCSHLERVVIPSLQNCGNNSDAFRDCFRLVSVDLPDSWGGSWNLTRMFWECRSLKNITLPASWPAGGISYFFYTFIGSPLNDLCTLPNPWPTGLLSANRMFSNSKFACFKLPDVWPNELTDVGGMFYENYMLSDIILPSSWNNVNVVNNMFRSNWSLSHVVMPTTRSQTITNYDQFFFDCDNLTQIDNYALIGSTTGQTSLFETFRGCLRLEGTYTFDCLLSRFSFYGYNGRMAKVTGIRLTNPGSLFGGVSPQIDVSYTSLDATALNTLFGDLPTLSGKTIKITGALGAGTCNTSIATGKGWTVSN